MDRRDSSRLVAPLVAALAGACCLAGFAAAASPLAAPSAPQPPLPRLLEAGPPDAARLTAAADYSEAHQGRALLVLWEGEPIFERYARGWDASRPHPLASGTKSFAGVLAMCAIEDGLISSLDERVADTLTAWQEDPRKSTITVRQLLDLSSGLVSDDAILGPQGYGIEGLAEGRSGPIAAALRQRQRSRMPDDRFAAAVTLPCDTVPGTRFRYGPSHYYAFGAFLEGKLRASGRPETSYWDYLSKRVLEPCGIAIGVDRFAPDPSGRPNLPGGGHLTAREWARFGEMIRRGGTVPAPLPASWHEPLDPRIVDGELRVMDAAALAACFEPSRTNPTYGLTWWLLTGQPGSAAEVADGVPGRRPGGRAMGGQRARQAAQTEIVIGPDGAPIRAVMAAGAGKQRLYVLPDLGLTIVRFAASGEGGAAFDDRTFLRTLLLDR